MIQEHRQSSGLRKLVGQVVEGNRPVWGIPGLVARHLRGWGKACRMAVALEGQDLQYQEEEGGDAEGEEVQGWVRDKHMDFEFYPDR